MAPVRLSVWRYIAAMSAVQVLAGWLFFRGGVGLYALLALPWTLVTGLILAANVHLLYTSDGTPLSRLNLATRVTLIRVLAIPLVCALVYEGRLRTAGLVFLVAAITDWLDGFLARRMGEVTQLGRMVDPSIDAIICFFSFGALFLAGHFPDWFIALVLLRYGILTLGALAMKAVLGRVPVQATFLGRLFYFIQYLLLVVFLLAETRVPEPGFRLLLGGLQLMVSVQLLVLGANLYRENRP